MIEQGIFFALGCIVTALMALAFAPLFWRRALRLTRRRLQLQIPLSMQEILAERDQLRAEFAVERLRIEQAMERIEATKAADMAEIGRRGVAATALADELTKVRAVVQGQDRDIADLGRRLNESDAESGTFAVALHGAFVRLEDATRARDGFEADAQRLHELAEARRITIASLETRVMGLEMRLTDAQRAGVLREQALTEEMTRGVATAMTIAAGHEAAGLALRQELDETKDKARTLDALLGERVAQIKMSDGVVAMLRAEISTLQAARHADARDVAAGAAASDALRRDLDEMTGKLGALNALLGERDARIETSNGLVATLRAEISTLQGARHADARDVAAGAAASDALRRELDEMTGKLGALNALLGERDARIETSDGLVATLRAEIDALRASRDAAARDVAAGAAALDALRRDLDDMTGKLGALNALLGERDARIQTSDGLVATLRAEIDALRASRDADIGDSLARAAALHTLRRDLDEASGKLRGSEQIVSVRDAHIETNASVVASLRAEVDTLQRARDGDARSNHDAASDAGLRETIHALGLAVATMTREHRLRRKTTDRRAPKSMDIESSKADAG